MALLMERVAVAVAALAARVGVADDIPVTVGVAVPDGVSVPSGVVVMVVPGVVGAGVAVLLASPGVAVLVA